MVKAGDVVTVRGGGGCRAQTDRPDHAQGFGRSAGAGDRTRGHAGAEARAEGQAAADAIRPAGGGSTAFADALKGKVQTASRGSVVLRRAGRGGGRPARRLDQLLRLFGGAPRHGSRAPALRPHASAAPRHEVHPEHNRNSPPPARASRPMPASISFAGAERLAGGGAGTGAAPWLTAGAIRDFAMSRSPQIGS